MFDWTDVRYFLAVARTGSTQSAGRTLRVDATTVARRIAALEQALGLTIFERRQSGYRLTPLGEMLLSGAEQLETAANAMLEQAAAAARDLSGSVRVTAEEFFAGNLLPAIIRELHEAYPSIRIELDTSDEPRDLAAGEAEIALRTSKGPPAGSSLVGRRVGWDPWAFYCSHGYAQAHGAPRNREELRSHPLITGGPPRVWESYREWLEANDMTGSVALHSDTVTGVLGAVRAGSGIAALPCLIAEFDPLLIRCLPPAARPRELWLLTTERLRRTPRIRAVLEFLAERLSRHSSELQARLDS